MSDGDSSLDLDRRQFLIGTAGAATLMLNTHTTAAEAAGVLKFGRNQSLDLDWRFHRGEGTGFEAVGYNDVKWRTLDLPHDWSIEDLPTQPVEPARIVGPFDQQAEGGTYAGFAVGGEGWYRKRLVLPTKSGRVAVRFEGVYMDCDVWLNGQHLGNHPNGYTPFAYDLTSHLSTSGDNVLAVRVRNLGQNHRWYSGSGLYRHVWLDVLPESACIERWGIGVVTRRVTEAGAEIEIETKVEDVTDGLVVVSRIKDAKGRVVGETSSLVRAQVLQSLTIATPQLWSPDKPHLYTLETELRRGHTILEREDTPFGVRVINFDATRGMTLNDMPIKLRGGSIHHDHGILGAAAFDAAEERKVALLKSRGYNAVRPSHNLFSPAFLRACDRQGMMVICETFDLWHEHKFPGDYASFFDAQWRTDLAAIVLSARNHPCIIMWSIGNEIPGRNTTKGMETQWLLANETHRLDPTRPVTAAINGFPGHVVTPSAQVARAGGVEVADRMSTVFLDVVGYNYKLADYEADHARFPQRVFFGSESFPKDVFAIWELTERTPWLIGDFVWTAMDYLGEAGIGGSVMVSPQAAQGPAPFGAWPWINAYCGDIDLIGQQKPPSLARDVAWGISPLEITVQRLVPDGKVELARFWGWSDELQSWSWTGAEGKPLAVRIYTVGDRVELRLNGQLVEAKAIAATDLKHIELKVAYVPGVLEVVAFRNGVEIARRRLETVSAPAAVRLIPERATGGAGRSDISYVAVELVDAQGRLIPDLNTEVHLSVSGPAELIAFGSANPLAVGSLQSSTAQTWHGRALAVVRSMGRPGHVTIQARSAGLHSGSASLRLVHLT